MIFKPNPNIRLIKPYQPGKPIEELKRDLKIKRVSKLASNENFMAPSEAVMRAVAKEMSNLNRYPDGSAYYLKKDLSRKFRVAQDRIIVGNGSDEIIMLALKAFTGPGDEILIADPTFLMYKISAQIAGTKIRSVPIKNYRYDLPRMAAAVTKKTKIIFIANPDNPTGSYVTGRELNQFLKRVPKNIMVFIDEAYYEYAQSSADYPHTMRLLGSSRPVIITRTFSKMHSLAGLRIGYGFADKKIIDYLNRVRDPFNVNTLAQVAARAALKDTKRLRTAGRLVDQGKKFLYDVFERLNVPYVRSATNFILFEVNQPQRVYTELLRQGIIVRNINPWGLKNCLRVTIGTADENKRFAAALKRVLKSKVRQ